MINISNYEIEPGMGDWLKDNLCRYYPEEEHIDELNNLITDYATYICSDRYKDLELTEKQIERLIELLLKLCLSLSSKPALYEADYKYMKNNWKPDWEICYGCSKRNTIDCYPNECNPLDI